MQYDPKTNKMIGFAPPLSNKTGLPDITKFVVTCVQDIEDAFKNEEICGNVLVFMAQPLAEGQPEFSLLLFGSNNKFKAEHGIICTKKQKKIGITIEGFSADSDTRCIKGMKVNSQLPSTFASKYSPYFQMRFDLDKPVYIQDTVHICTKLKTRLTNPNVTMIMGNFNVSIVHLQNLIAKVTKDKHLLCNSDLDNGIVKFRREEEGRLGMSSFSGANTFLTTEYLFNLMKMAESSAIADAGNFGMLGNFINLQILMNVSEMTFLHEYSYNDDENTTQANSMEDYMSESETIEIQDDISVFSSIDELKLKQFKSSCDTTTSKSNQYIEVPLKNGSRLLTYRQNF
ncbi:hypothetical protein FQA39_LY05992 [Lamprigera yunnana]|nr:hypothetical protein FQA39_LY05992 [Lamprigera yunnana]